MLKRTQEERSANRTAAPTVPNRRAGRAAAVIAAALLCALLVGVAVKWGAQKSPAEAAPASNAKPVTAAKAASPAPTPRDVADLTPAAKRRGIQVCDFAEGSKFDPAAPPHAMAVYRDRREAELKKWRETTIEMKYEDVPLHEIVAEFLRKWNLKVGLDAGVSPNTRISVQISGMDAAGSHSSHSGNTVS